MSLTKQTKYDSHVIELADVQKYKGRAAKVVTALYEYPYSTRRQLSHLTKLEISSLCSVIDRLTKAAMVYAAFDMPCDVTGKMVAVYALRTGVLTDEALAHLRGTE